MSWIFKFLDVTTNSAVGESFTVQAQNATGTTSTGGALNLAAGTGTSVNGDIVFKRGTTQIGKIATAHGLASFGGAGSDYVTKIGPMPSFETGDAGIWFLASEATAASSSNVSLYGNGSQTILNVPVTGTFIGFLDAGAAYFGQWDKTELRIMTGGLVTFTNSISAPKIYQADITTNSITGETLTIQAQNATGTTTVGGSLSLAAGTGTSTHGSILFKRGSTQVANISTAHGHFVAGIDSTDAQTHIGPLVGSETSLAAVYLLAPSTARTSGNYNFAAGGGLLYTNGPTGIVFLVGGTQYAGLGTSNFSLTGGVGLMWTATSTSPKLYQDDETAASTTGKTLIVQAQNSTGTTSIGGILDLRGGTGTTSAGAVQIRPGSTNIIIEAAEVAAGRNVVSLARKSAITTTQLPANTGDGIVYIANAATAPTADPVSGGILYVEGGALKYRGTSGTVTVVAPA